MSLEQLVGIKYILGSLAILGLYSVLYRENVVYRFFEHLFLGLAAGFALVALWKDTLYGQWWLPMVGTAENNTVVTPGFWAYAFLLPVGLMAYMVFSKNNNWMSRVPIGIIIGLWSGQQVQIWWNTYGPQIYDSMKPVFPTTMSSFFQPSTTQLVNGAIVPVDNTAEILGNIYMSQVLNNIIFLVTLVSALAYFLFSFKLESKAAMGFNKLGRWMLMIGFGAIFGSTVMARFALVIDRLSYVLVDTFQHFQGGG